MLSVTRVHICLNRRFVLNLVMAFLKYFFFNWIGSHIIWDRVRNHKDYFHINRINVSVSIRLMCSWLKLNPWINDKSMRFFAKDDFNSSISRRKNIFFFSYCIHSAFCGEYCADCAKERVFIIHLIHIKSHFLFLPIEIGILLSTLKSFSISKKKKK